MRKKNIFLRRERSSTGNDCRRNQCSRRIVLSRSHMIHVHCKRVLWSHRVLPMYRHRMGILSMSSLGHGILNHICNPENVQHPMHYRIVHQCSGYQCSYHNLCHCLEQRRVRRHCHRQRCERNHLRSVQETGKFRVHCRR